MSKVFKSAADYFNIYGELIEESVEFAEVKLEDYVDEFVPVKPLGLGTTADRCISISPVEPK